MDNIAAATQELIRRATIYFELVGGLGDSILRMYFSGKEWYEPLAKLGPNSTAVVSLMCHNPYLAEVFQWHPKADRIHVLDFGFTTPFHPWENEGWRVAHGLPKAAPCPPYAPSKSLRFYPSPEDEAVLSELKAKPFIILAATAGQPEKTIPLYTREKIASVALDEGFNVVVVGRSRYFLGERTSDVSFVDGIINVVDRLSVPGVAQAVKRAAGVVSADTSVLHMAWQEYRPVFLLYNHWTVENLLPHGPVGYMQGINRPDTDHMEFTQFETGRFARWLRARRAV
jgi:hypothetical protein